MQYITAIRLSEQITHLKFKGKVTNSIINTYDFPILQIILGKVSIWGWGHLSIPLCSRAAAQWWGSYPPGLWFEPPTPQHDTDSLGGVLLARTYHNQIKSLTTKLTYILNFSMLENTSSFNSLLL